MSRKHITGEKEVLPIEKEVVLPESLRKALYALTKEPTEIEWGGGIDFEMIEGKARVERLLSYLGAYSAIPARVFRKYASDIEVMFHTHPKGKALPSVGDLHTFLQFPHQIELIVAPKKILIIEKTRKATPEKARLAEKIMSPEVYISREKFAQVMRDLGLKWEIIPRDEKIKFDLKVVRNLKGVEFGFQRDLVEATSPIPFIIYFLKLNRVPEELRLILRNIFSQCSQLYKVLEDCYKEKYSGKEPLPEIEKKYKPRVEDGIGGLTDKIWEWCEAIGQLRRITEEFLSKTFVWEELEVYRPERVAHDDIIAQVKKLISADPVRPAFPPNPKVFSNAVSLAIVILQEQQERQDILQGRQKPEEVTKKEALRVKKSVIIGTAGTLSTYLSMFLDSLKMFFPFEKYSSREHLS